jgi:PAS domain-containing protein
MGVHKPDGALTWILINSEPLYDAEGTKLTGVVASFADITDRKRTEEALRQTSTELAAIRQKMPAASRRSRLRPN